jgi:hypothetical protein
MIKSPTKPFYKKKSNVGLQLAHLFEKYKTISSLGR